MTQDRRYFRMPDGHIATTARVLGSNLYGPVWLPTAGMSRNRRIKGTALPVLTIDLADLTAKLAAWATARGAVEVTESQIYAGGSTQSAGSESPVRTSPRHDALPPAPVPRVRPSR